MLSYLTPGCLVLLLGTSPSSTRFELRCNHLHNLFSSLFSAKSPFSLKLGWKRAHTWISSRGRFYTYEPQDCSSRSNGICLLQHYSFPTKLLPRLPMRIGQGSRRQTDKLLLSLSPETQFEQTQYERLLYLRPSLQADSMTSGLP